MMMIEEDKRENSSNRVVELDNYRKRGLGWVISRLVLVKWMTSCQGSSQRWMQ